MKSILTMLFAVSIMGSVTAIAADAPSTAPAPAGPAFAPVTLSQADMNTITNYLGQMPFNQAAPLMFFLSQKEADAQAAAAKKK